MKIRYLVTALVIAAIMIYKKTPEPPWFIEITPSNHAIIVDIYKNVYVCRLPANWREANYTCEEDFESIHYW